MTISIYLSRMFHDQLNSLGAWSIYGTFKQLAAGPFEHLGKCAVR